MMHIGDEAMFEQFVVQARARGIHNIVGVSSNPIDTAERYGIESVARLGLSGDRSAMIAQAPHAELPALDTVDAVVITGAGNLASTWPVHIVERLELARRARARGIPFVITGQTLGPGLVPDDELMLAELLQSAALVGVRESASFALASRLGVEPARLRVGADDASFLGLAAGEHPDSGPYVLVSLSTHVGAADRTAFVDSVATLLDSLAAVSGVEIVFLAHYGPLAEPWQRGDVVMHEAVAARMTSPTRAIPTGTAAEAARLARSASMVVTSRYHPAVFAGPAGVATLGIAVDDYTTVKLRGALGAFGQDAVVAAAELADAPSLAERLWAARHEIRVRGQVIAAERRAESDDWWDRVVTTLGAA
jgi:polysaccharide pyruvyl transferase WcaK-like protein